MGAGRRPHGGVLARGITTALRRKEQSDFSAIDALFVRNRLWADRKVKAVPDFFKELAKGQSPNFMWIGCSDSRVAPTEITDSQSGEMFVHRNVANMVINSDVSLLCGLQFAIEALGVRDIVVCGHYGCGGVENSMKHENMGQMNAWLQNIKDVYRLYQKELDAIEDNDQRLRRLVECNVLEQCLNLSKISFVQESIRSTGLPRIHGLVYEMGTGELKRIGDNLHERLAEIADLYAMQRNRSENGDL